MTPQEALAVLYRFWDVYWQQTTLVDEQPPQRTARQEVENTAYHALLALTDTIHGEAPLHGSHFLCDVCHLRYADGHVYEDGNDQELGGLCKPCRVAREAQPLPVHQEMPV